MLITIFKDDNFEEQKEIHNEIMFKQVYECEKFPPIINFFIDMYIKDPNARYCFILWKLCVIDSNPLIINQLAIFKAIFKDKEPGPHRIDYEYEAKSLDIIFVQYSKDGSVRRIAVRDLNKKVDSFNFIRD